LGVSSTDFSQMLPAIKLAYRRMTVEYKEKTHPRLRILDNLIVFCLVTFAIQIIYANVVGKDPYNSLLAGLFCSLGQFALAGKFHPSPKTLFSFPADPDE
jgi:hypothetical protein